MVAVLDITLTSDDVFSFECSVELADSTEIYELQGVTAGVSGNTDVYSRAPSTAPGGGKNADTVQRKSPDDQDQANEWAGMCYAQHEGIFIDADGVKWRVGDLTLRCPGQYNVLDFSAVYVRFDYQGRRMDFSRFLFTLKRFNYEIDADSGDSVTVFVFAPATAAPPGKTYVPPVGDTAATTDPSDVFGSMIRLGSGNNGLSKVGDLYGVDSSNALVWRHLRGADAWDDTIDLTALGVAGTLLDATWRVGGNVARLLTSGEAGVLSNYSSGTPVFGAPHIFPESLMQRQMEFERGEPDWGVIVSYLSGAGVIIDYTTNNLTTVTRPTLPIVFSNYDNGGGEGFIPGLWIDPHRAGHAVVSVCTNTASIGSGLTTALYETSDHGATWALLTSVTVTLGNWGAIDIVVAFLDTGAANIYHNYTSAASAFFLYRNNVDISPNDGARSYGLLGARSLDIADDDPNSLMLVGYSGTGAGGYSGVFHSADGGASWETLVTPSTSITYTKVYFVNRSTAYLIGLSGLVALWTAADGLVDLSIPTGGDLVALMGA